MSIFCASIAALARTINSAAVSLGVCIHIAQIRASTCLALASSGAAFSAPNKKSSPRVRSAPTFGSLLGGSGRFFPCSLGGMTRGSFWAKAAVGNAAITAATRIADRQFGALKNLNVIGRSLDVQNRAAKRRHVKDL